MKRFKGWFMLAWLGWFALVLVSLGLFVAAIPGRFSQLVGSADYRALFDLGMSARTYASYILALNLLLLVAHDIIAAVIFWRRRDDWIALFVAYALVTNGALIPLAILNKANLVLYGWGFLVEIIIAIALVSGIGLLFVFPDGRFIPRQTIFIFAVWIVIVIFAVFLPETPFSLSKLTTFWQILILLVISGTGIFAQIHRYIHVSKPLERQQAKWALSGLIAGALGPMVFFLPFVIVPSLQVPEASNLLYQRVGPTFFTVSFVARQVGASLISLGALVFPISFTIAVLRYRLWDIDILINRALVYTVLTGSLILIYFVSVIMLQNTLQVLTGEGQPEVVTVVSTLGIAAVFVPLRRRVQAEIDRRFYRQKYDAALTLASFSEKLRDEVDLEELSNQLITVVQSTMQPECISLWLKPSGDTKKARN